ncbi:MAG: hypothetical protein JJU46_05730 [Balneolaceae bacterium]|nr:hypothetical protein [Balneolaceae bacterium]MCH8549256.1 hypothetical protein [Balneolaceae bacterium]
MKKLLISGFFALLLFFSFHSNSEAQRASLLGNNLLNGAITGSALGAATMALNNSNDFAPLRVGLGAGIIGGAGIALYDVATLPSGQRFFISGIFNDGNNSSIIILLDTMYGVAGGALIGTAAMLIANRPVVDGLQYGAGIGAWTGFTFGLVDSFLYAERNRDLMSVNSEASGSFFTYSDKNRNLELDMVRPKLHNYTDLSGSTLSVEFEPAVELFSLRKSF